VSWSKRCYCRYHVRKCRSVYYEFCAYTLFHTAPRPVNTETLSTNPARVRRVTRTSCTWFPASQTPQHRSRDLTVKVTTRRTHRTHVHLPAPDAPPTVAMRRRTADPRTRPPHTACNRTAARSARSPRDHVESARARALMLNGHKANGDGSLAQQRTGYQNGPHFTPRLRVISPWALRVAARARATASVTS